MLFNAHQHAREHLTVEMALYLIELLTDNYGTDPRITSLVTPARSGSSSSMNPDGSEYDICGGSHAPTAPGARTASPTPARAPSAPTSTATTATASAAAAARRAAASSTVPRAAGVLGPRDPGLRDFVNSRVIDGVQQIRTHIDFHTYGELVLWPFGYTKTNVPPDMTPPTRRVRGARPGDGRTNGYTAEQSSDLYITDGDQTTGSTASHRIFSYTFEMYPTEKPTVWGDHYPADSKIAKQTARNRSRSCCSSIAPPARTRPSGPPPDSRTAGRSRRLRDQPRLVGQPDGKDTASSGLWTVPTRRPRLHGAKQLGNAVSGSGALVTGAAAGRQAGSNDVDGGVDLDPQPPDPLPADPANFGRLTFSYVFAHSATSTTADAFRVLVEAEDGTRTPVFERFGGPTNLNATWRSGSASLADYAGQTIRL